MMVTKCESCAFRNGCTYRSKVDIFLNEIYETLEDDEDLMDTPFRIKDIVLSCKNFKRG